MADVKWIQIVTDIFDDEKMVAIESLPDGYLIEIVWFKLLCLAGKCNENGYIVVTKDIPYTDEALAKNFRMELGVVQRALDTFQNMRMIEVVDDFYMVSNWLKYQNITGLDKIREQNRERQKRFRDTQKKLLNCNTCAYCGDKATGFDHIIPKSKGGSDNDYNKVPCCARCNNLKTTLDLASFLNFNRERIKDDLVTANDTLKQYVTLNNVTNRYENNVIPSISNSLSNNNKDIYKDDIDSIIQYFNTKVCTKYRLSTESIRTPIRARLADGFTVDECKAVIDKKYDEWHGTDMQKYLRPSTLFRPSHFEEYLNQDSKGKKSAVSKIADIKI